MTVWANPILRKNRDWPIAAGLTAILFALAVISLFAGRVIFPPAQILNALFSDVGDAVDLIVWHLRLPRTLLAIVVGASLGMGGAALQGLLRNPLAEPGIVGVSASAAFGSVLVFYSGIAVTLPLAQPLGGMMGAMLGISILMLLAGRRPGVLTLILAGVAVNSLAGAFTALALNLSPNPYSAAEIVFWLMGSLADRSFESLWLAMIVTVPGWALLLSVRSALDALTLGEDAAKSLGINLRAIRWRTVTGLALAVGAGVAVCGTISFVGLVVPHLLRPLVGYEPGRLLPISALGGAILLLLTDIVVRLLPTGIELKIGVLTALIGAPFFLVLLVKTRRAIQ
jgi:iron complex transport system permease protein